MVSGAARCVGGREWKYALPVGENTSLELLKHAAEGSLSTENSLQFCHCPRFDAGRAMCQQGTRRRLIRLVVGPNGEPVFQGTSKYVMQFNTAEFANFCH
jgi:hypothetical protein